MVKKKGKIRSKKLKRWERTLKKMNGEGKSKKKRIDRRKKIKRH